MSKKIEPNAGETIQQVANQKNEQINSETVDTSKIFEKLRAKQLKRYQQHISSLVLLIYLQNQDE